MIPYDDLVAALNNWRARQGLPVASGGAANGSGPTAAPSMMGSPPSGPARTAPPNAPPRGAGGYGPPPLADATDDAMGDAMPEALDDSLDVDDAALLEEAHYENEGGDFAMNFGQPPVENDAESTTMGHAPEPVREAFGRPDVDAKSRKPW